MWNYGKLSAKSLVSRIKVIDTAGFFFFFKFHSYTTTKISLNNSTQEQPRGQELFADFQLVISTINDVKFLQPLAQDSPINHSRKKKK